jgi:hypothetical protein
VSYRGPVGFLRRYFIIVCALIGPAWFADYIYSVAQIPGYNPFTTLSFWMIVLVPVCLGFLLATVKMPRRPDEAPE